MENNFKVNMNEYLPLRDVVFNTLRQAILKGELAPGERLMEIQLAEKLGVSRTPIRAALMDLCHTSLVTFVPGKGIYVSVIGLKDIEEIYEVRALLDPAVLLSFMKQATPDQIAALRGFANNMKEAVRMENKEMLIENDVNFHQYYTDYCGNARLAAIICSTVDPFHRFRYITTSSMKMNAVFVEEHLLIMKAIEENDQVEAELQMKAHYSHLKRYLIQKLTSEGQL